VLLVGTPAGRRQGARGYRGLAQPGSDRGHAARVRNSARRGENAAPNSSVDAGRRRPKLATL